jgi:phosphohistidine phosphatase
MKTLLVMRHAKSSWKEASLPDHERPLNKRGQRDAPAMGRRLQGLPQPPQAILSSTAVRARATAAAVAEAVAYEGQIELVAGFYTDAPAAYFTALRRLPETVNVALIIAHNPSVEEMVSMLTGEDETMPTAAIAHIHLPIETWQALTPDTEAALADFWRPEHED